MARLSAVNSEEYAGRKWLRASSYAFAAGEMVASVALAELAQVASSLPLAFFEQAGRYTLVAILSLGSPRNMCVDPQGKWLTPYVPAVFRSHPFRLAPKAGTDQVMLCIDLDGGLVTEGAPNGEDFFTADGQLAPLVKSLWDFLVQLERSRKMADLAVAALADAGLIRPWPIKLKTEQGVQTIGAFHQIDEAALSTVSDDIFLKLRRASALPVAYAQMLSMGQLGMFERLATQRSQVTPPKPVPAAVMPETLDKIFGFTGDDIVRFR